MAKGWLNSLKEAVVIDGRSLRAISGEAGLGPNYLSEVLNGGKEPTVPKLLRICRVLKVSASTIITGAELTPQAEEMLAILGDLPEDQQELLFSLARSLRKGER